MAWYLADHLGSVRDLTDTQGGVIDHVQYDSFGSVLSETNPSAGDRFKFTGREYDEATGQYYYRARYYEPATGRFTSEDPIRFQAGDPNLYRYVRNAPTIATDPTGESGGAAHEEEEVEVAAYDGDDSGGRKWKTADGDDFKEAADDYDHAIDFPSWGDFIETLEEFVEEHGLIDRLYVFDHGFSGGQWVGDVVLTPEMAEDLEPFLDDDAVILLGGCDVARDREYLEDIAEAANAIVIASDDDVIYWPFPNPFGRDYYSKGDWIPGEPPDSGR